MNIAKYSTGFIGIYVLEVASLASWHPSISEGLIFYVGVVGNGNE
jgi:hypothetical protein